MPARTRGRNAKKQPEILPHGFRKVKRALCFLDSPVNGASHGIRTVQRTSSQALERRHVAEDTASAWVSPQFKRVGIDCSLKSEQLARSKHHKHHPRMKLGKENRHNQPSGMWTPSTFLPEENRDEFGFDGMSEPFNTTDTHCWLDKRKLQPEWLRSIGLLSVTEDRKHPVLAPETPCLKRLRPKRPLRLMRTVPQTPTSFASGQQQERARVRMGALSLTTKQ